MTENPACSACGMCAPAPAYHPFLACVAFRQLRNGTQVQANLQAVVEYGMRAQRAGVSLEKAMADLTAVLPEDSDG